MLETRTAARLLVLDENSRILLFLHSDGHGREFWATPGGGVQPGETLEQAAQREASEELGIDKIELSPAWTGYSEFDYADRRVSQVETFFYARYHGEISETHVYRTHQEEGIKQIRWWSLEEIENYEGLLFPIDLADRLRNKK